MISTSQKLLHRAKSLRRLHHASKPSADDVAAMPPSPTSPSFSLPLPPAADRPRTHYGGPASSSAHTAHDDLVLDAFHIRQASHASRASSSWSSTTSTTSTTSAASSLSSASSAASTSSSAKIQWDSLRLHPPPMPHTPRYDAGRSFYYEDASCFDFGFDNDDGDDGDDAAFCAKHDSAGIQLVSSDDDAQVFQGLSPPPRHHTMRAPQASTTTAATTTAPAPTLRIQQDDSESERFFKRGDWKRRGIVFGYDHAI